MDAGLGPVELGGRGGGRTAGEIAADGPGLIAGEEPAARPGMDAGSMEIGAWAQALQKDGLAWPVRGAAAEPADARGAAPVERTARGLRAARDGGDAALAEAVGRLGPDGARIGAEWAVGDGAADPPGEGRQDAAGLEGLYRQTVRAALPAAPALPQGTAGQAVRAREAEGAAALAVEELDRAVRRDSRRYDGGMTIF